MSTGDSNKYGSRTLYAGKYSHGTKPDEVIKADIIPGICQCTWVYKGPYPFGSMVLKFRAVRCPAYEKELHQ